MYFFSKYLRAFKDEWNGIAVSSNDPFGGDTENKAFRTSDGGVTWTPLDIPAAPRAQKIYFIPGSADESSCGTYMLFRGAITPSGLVYSTDDGQTWTMVSEIPVHTVEFLSPEIGWMGSRIINAEERGLYKWTGESLAGDASCVSSAKEEIVSSENLSVFPNPVSGIATIQLNNDWQGALNLRVMNTLGQVVFRKSLEKQSGEMSWELEVNRLLPGAYQLLISNGKEVMAKVLVKI